jgi:hypothetical protein
MSEAVSTLHITNGDIVAEKLRTVFDGPVAVTADPLHEGPAAALEDDAWREQRARYLAAGDAAIGEVRATLSGWDAQIAAAGQHDETVLWFEHDLFDQLLLVRTLDLLGRQRGTARPARVSLICINAYLGYLTPAELHGLWPSRAPVTDAQYAIAHQVWQAYRQPHPTALVAARRQLRTDREAWAPMPFLGDAIERFFEEFPSTTNGLSRTADTALRLLDDQAALAAGDLFRRTVAFEPRMFLGDSSFFSLLHSLAAAATPLVTVAEDGAAPLSNGAPAADWATRAISLTHAGRAVVHGEDDAVRLNGIDTWRGGLHLAGAEAAWRWDPVRKTLISWS